MESQQHLYDDIKEDYEEAYKCLDKALIYDEENKKDEALPMYEFGLNLIDKALNTPLVSPSQPDLQWEKTYAMIQKMRKTRKEILIRIGELETKPHAEENLPPSYEEAVASASGTFKAPNSTPVAGPSNQTYIPPSAAFDPKVHPSSSPSYTDLSAQLQEMQVDTSNREILYSHNNVRLYFIAPDGRVSSTSAPDVLIIGRINESEQNGLLYDTLQQVVDQLEDEKGENHHHRSHKSHRGKRRHHHGRHRHKEHKNTPKYQGSGQIYLQVGSWVYPLIPGISPCFRSDFGAFVLPDLNSETDGAAIGIMLPPEADQSVYELLNSILSGVLVSEGETSHRRSRRSGGTGRRPSSSSNVSANILKGATYIANNIIKGAGTTARYIDSATPRLISKIQPQPDQPVNPTLKKTIDVAKSVSGTAVNVSDYIATRVGQGAAKLGEYLAPFVQKQGEKLLTSTTSMSEVDAKEKVGSVLEVTSSTARGIATVYNSLESAAALLGNSLANNSVQIIEHRYGHPLGEATNSALQTAANVYLVRRGVKSLKPMGIVSATAKETTNNLLPFQAHDNSKAHEGFEGPGPGDGSGFRKM